MIPVGHIPSLRYVCSCSAYKFSTLGASLSAPRADKEHIFTEAHSWGPCMRATEMAAWWQQSSNCQEGTGSLQRGRVQPGSALAAEAEPAPPPPRCDDTQLVPDPAPSGFKPRFIAKLWFGQARVRARRGGGGTKKVPLGILCAQPVTRVHAYRRGERESDCRL